TRVGGVGHNKRQKHIAATIMKILAQYRQAEEFSHFGSELSPEAKAVLEQGKNIFALLGQGPTDVFNLMSQQLMLDIAISTEINEKIDIPKLRTLAVEYSEKVKKDEDYEKIRDELKKKSLVEIKK
ncbi:MAG: sodium-transporting two-sector ATPase, partial [Patescibacteria group bacterium]